MKWNSILFTFYELLVLVLSDSVAFFDKQSSAVRKGVPCSVHYFYFYALPPSSLSTDDDVVSCSQ
jgi:hypothetical protein